jgi:hypothetical protein
MLFAPGSISSTPQCSKSRMFRVAREAWFAPATQGALRRCDPSGRGRRFQNLGDDVDSEAAFPAHASVDRPMVVGILAVVDRGPLRLGDGAIDLVNCSALVARGVAPDRDATAKRERSAVRRSRSDSVDGPSEEAARAETAARTLQLHRAIIVTSLADVAVRLIEITERPITSLRRARVVLFVRDVVARASEQSQDFAEAARAAHARIDSRVIVDILPVEHGGHIDFVK